MLAVEYQRARDADTLASLIRILEVPRVETTAERISPSPATTAKQSWGPPGFHARCEAGPDVGSTRRRANKEYPDFHRQERAERLAKIGY